MAHDVSSRSHYTPLHIHWRRRELMATGCPWQATLLVVLVGAAAVACAAEDATPRLHTAQVLAAVFRNLDPAKERDVVVRASTTSLRGHVAL